MAGILQVNQIQSLRSRSKIYLGMSLALREKKRMNRKGLAILMRRRMRGADHGTKLPTTVHHTSNEDGGKEADSNSKQYTEHFEQGTAGDGLSSFQKPDSSNSAEKRVQELMHTAIFMNKTELIDTTLDKFLQGYFGLSQDNHQKLLLILATEYSVDRTRIRELMQQYLGLELPGSEEAQQSGLDEEGLLSAFYRTERNLRQALKPMYEVLFERLNTHPGGLKFLSTLRADLLSMIKEENIASLRAMDSYLKEKLITWLSPAALELHRITWDDSASLLEKIVVYEAVHPISNLQDLKRRLGVGRRCFGYLHPALPGEPLIFIEVALLKNVAHSIQEVLWDDPPTPESEATCALFYSISSTQTFATLSPIPGYMQWLLSKLASQSKLAESEIEESSLSGERLVGGTFRENILLPEEERAILDSSEELVAGKNGMEVMLKLLTSKDYEWAKTDKLLAVLQSPLMRLCTRYLFKEKKRGKALDSVGNFHLQNGAIIGRLNWMADRSEKGLCQSGGIMVNYIYRMDEIEENAQLYFSTGRVKASSDFDSYLEG